MEELVLKAQHRKETGKGFGRRLRAQGLLPAVVYGDNKNPEHLIVNRHDLQRLMQHGTGEGTIISLKIEGPKAAGEQKVLIRDIQKDPVTMYPIHADFYRVSLTKKLKVEVPVRGIGTPEGVKAGGILEHLTRSIEIKCLPDAIPRSIDVDVNSLGVNHSIHVRDLKVAEGIEILSDPETALFTVLPPRVEEEVVAAAAAPTEELAEEGAEPELITRKKGEEEGAEEKPKAEEKPEKKETKEKK
jgi:large subunit ribosomal protein L25